MAAHAEAAAGGDALMVKSMDRFDGNYDEIIEQWRSVIKERGVADMVLDTRTRSDNVTVDVH